MAISRRNKKKKILNTVKEIANKSNCNITEFEVFGDFIIGIFENDESSYFFKYVKDQKLAQTIHLNEIKSSEIRTANRNYQSGGENFSMIEKLEINFLPSEPGKPYILMEFYNVEESIQLDEEYRLIEKWVKIINETIIQRTKRGKIS
jgi:hypothetical protein